MVLALDKVAWIHLDERRLLVTRNHGRGLFYLPGGRREPGETDAEALVREIAEMAWIAYPDRDRTSALDQLVIDHLRISGHLD